jgi:hypothetical protein
MLDGKCPHHTTTVSEATKTSWRRRGHAASMRARLPVEFTPAAFDSEQSARRVLEETADLVRAGKMPTSVANAVSKLAGVAIRATELDVLRRLASLEKRLAPEKKR